MSLESIYRDAMELNAIKDMGKREETAKAFFEKLNKTELPAKFNWAAEIFEGMHVKERGDQPALIWTDLDTDAESQFTYKEMAANGNKFLNFVRKNGVTLYVMKQLSAITWDITGGATITADANTSRSINCNSGDIIEFLFFSGDVVFHCHFYKSLWNQTN